MMLCKNRKKRVGLCVMVVTSCLVLATLWAVLATPETALADPPDKPDKPNPGGNVVQQDIPGKLTLDGGALTGDDQSSLYSDSEAGTTCFIGRRRGIWVKLSKTSDRTMNLTLGTAVVEDSYILIPEVDRVDESDGEIRPGDDPWGFFIDTPPVPPPAANWIISQVDLGIAPFLNVSGLPEGQTLDASTWLLFLDGDNQWGLYFGPGRNPEHGWGGARFFTDLDTLCVEIECNVLNQSWTVDSSTPGYLWYRGSRKNAPWVYVGKYINVSWSCNVEYIP